MFKANSMLLCESSFLGALLLFVSEASCGPQLLGPGIIGPSSGSDPFTPVVNGILGTNVQSTPSSVQDVFNNLASIFPNNTGSSTNMVTGATELVSQGMGGQNLNAVASGQLTGENSSNNNPQNPAQPVFPQKAAGDAPYSLSESVLRGAIFIPSTFTYGQKQPVILAPGTGDSGFETYSGNFIQLLTNQPYADPVWLNIPGNLLGDAQVNSEFVAYAMNYISGISANKNVSVISWSQGGLNTQWALKFWPSTRSIVSNFIAMSPDYKGTVEAFLACTGIPLLDTLTCAPSVFQQRFASNFVKTLSADGGNSAFVPTTTVFSATDEVVEPQSGPDASALLADERGVGVTNNLVQQVCAGQPGGGLYTHEGVLYNPLAGALAVDALMNGGPGQVSRINVQKTCAQLTTPGLGLSDVLLTESTIVIAAVNILTFPQKVNTEPPIMSYAAQGGSGK